MQLKVNGKNQKPEFCFFLPNNCLLLNLWYEVVFLCQKGGNMSILQTFSYICLFSFFCISGINCGSDEDVLEKKEIIITKNSNEEKDEKKCEGLKGSNGECLPVQ